MTAMEKNIEKFMDWILSSWEQGKITDSSIIAAIINYIANRELAKSATPDTCEICGYPDRNDAYVRCTRCGKIIGRSHYKIEFKARFERCYISMETKIGDYIVEKVMCVECVTKSSKQ